MRGEATIAAPLASDLEEIRSPLLRTTGSLKVDALTASIHAFVRECFISLKTKGAKDMPKMAIFHLLAQTPFLMSLMIRNDHKVRSKSSVDVRICVRLCEIARTCTRASEARVDGTDGTCTASPQMRRLAT